MLRGRSLKLTAQAIAFGELSKPARAEVITVSLADANTLHLEYSSIKVEELAVEIAVSVASNIVDKEERSLI